MDTTKDLNPERPAGISGSHPENDRPASTSGNKTDSIRADIERTREKTMRTINELERRLSPSRLMADVKEMTRKATSGRTSEMTRQTGETSKRWGSVLYDTFVSNPVPSMMIGGGLAWLIASEIRKEGSEEESDEFVERRRTIGTDATGTYGMGFIDRRKSTEALERTGRKASEKAAEVREKTAKYGEQLRSKAAQTGEQVKHKAEEISASAAAYGRRAQDSLMQGSKSAREGFFHTLESNPLAAAGVALMAGAAIGLMVPETHYEDETLGPQRNEMFERAREAGREKVEQVEAVVREAKESAKDEAERQGLVSRESADKAEREISRASDEFKSSVMEKSHELKEKAPGEFPSSQSDKIFGSDK